MKIKQLSEGKTQSKGEEIKKKIIERQGKEYNCYKEIYWKEKINKERENYRKQNMAKKNHGNYLKERKSHKKE